MGVGVGMGVGMGVPRAPCQCRVLTFLLGHEHPRIDLPHVFTRGRLLIVTRVRVTIDGAVDSPDEATVLDRKFEQITKLG